MNFSSNSYCARLTTLAHQLVERLTDADLRAAFLFGSAAWGDADATSDLDIMLLLNRPSGYREVTRMRLADLGLGPFQDGPAFVDLDRVSVEDFTNSVNEGRWSNRLMHAIILKDTDSVFEHLRTKVSKDYLEPAARAARFHIHEQKAEAEHSASFQALDKDSMLAALHARLALQEAGVAFIELSGNRFSSSHFVENLERALSYFDNSLFARVLAALCLNASDEAVKRSLHAYDTLAQALKKWVDDPNVRNQLSQEHLAWAQFTYGEQTYEEMAQKVTVLTQAERLPALLYYLDGMLQIPMRMQMGRIFLLRSKGMVGTMSIADFQVALREVPVLYNEWTTALRLQAERTQVLEVGNLTTQLLAVGRNGIETEASPMPS